MTRNKYTYSIWSLSIDSLLPDLTGSTNTSLWLGMGNQHTEEEFPSTLDLKFNYLNWWDEVLFKGIFGGWQHCRGKPMNTGLKVFTNADALSSYLYDFWFYEVCIHFLYLFNLFQGKEPANRRFPEWSARPKDIVVDFVCGLPSGTVVVVGSFYGSLDLATTLHEMGYYFIMVCQANRPSEVRALDFSDSCG